MDSTGTNGGQLLRGPVEGVASPPARRITTTRPYGRPLPLHVMLLPAVPVVALWAGNATEVRGWAPVTISLILSGLALVLMGIFTLVQRDMRRSGLVASVLVLVFGAYGHFIPRTWSPALGLSLTAVVILLLVMLAVRASATAVAHLTRFMNVIAIALVAANAVVVLANRPGPLVDLPRIPDPSAVTSPVDGPDIWYVVPDRYPALDRLEAMGIDTDGFEDELTARGFKVADEAWANYPSTPLSLASAWNVTPLPSEPETISRGQAAAMLRDPAIGQLYRQSGYDYLHLGTWFDPTASSASATQVLTLQGATEFYFAFDQASIVPTLRQYVDLSVPGFASSGARHISHAQHQLATLQQLAREPESGRPQFLLTHITLPHPGFVFHADGSVRAETPAPAQHAAAYEEQLQYLNSQLLSLIDVLQARPEPPLILIMADEGVSPEDVSSVSKDEYTMRDLAPGQVRDKLSIIAAVYDPTDRIDLSGRTTPLAVIEELLGATIGVDVEVADTPSYFPSPDGPGLMDVSELLTQ